MAASKISVDLLNRTFDVEVEAGDLPQVVAMLSDLLAKHGATPSKPSPSTGTSGAESANADDQSDEKAGKKRRGASKGPTKSRTYKTVELGLSPADREEIKKFFAEKSPKGQSNEVATLAVKLQEKMKKSQFSLDEIHSAFRIINKPTPRNLTAVFGNMKRDGIAGYENYEIHVNSFTEDHVNHHMASEGKKA